MKKKMLLHSCCGPCSTAVIDRLKEEFDLTVFYYNPNIFPQREYVTRLSEQQRYVKEVGLDIEVIDGGYNDFRMFEGKLKRFRDDAEGGKRCQICISLRLEKTAKEAKRKGYDFFASTLSVSPHKNVFLINKIGKELSEKWGVAFFEADFKKKDGYLKSVRVSQKFNLYRQKYCGCKYSMKNYTDLKREG